MTAITGPIFLAIFSRDETRAGALTIFMVGVGAFSVLKMGLIQGAWFDGTLAIYTGWLQS